MKRKVKGLGTKSARQLVASEKAKLTIWVHERKDRVSKENAFELAKSASDDLGFEVSHSSIMTIRNSLFPELVMKRGRKSKLDERDQKIASLEKRIEIIEKQIRLYVLPTNELFR